MILQKLTIWLVHDPLKFLFLLLQRCALFLKSDAPFFNQVTQRYVGSVINRTNFEVVASHENRTMTLTVKSRDNTVRSCVKSPLTFRLIYNKLKKSKAHQLDVGHMSKSRKCPLNWQSSIAKKLPATACNTRTVKSQQTE